MAPILPYLVTQAANAKNAYSLGQREREQEGLQNALQAYKLQQTAKSQSLQDALAQAHAGYWRAQGEAALRPPPAPRDYVKEHELNRDYDLAHPGPTTPDLASRLQGRVTELTKGGMKLADANKQARLEFGQQPEQNAFSVATLGGNEGEPPTVQTYSTKTGEKGPVLGEGKQPVTRIESAQNTMAKARMEAAISEMNNAHEGMADFERKLVNKQISINGLQQFIGGAGSSFTHDDPASRAIQSGALAILNKTNPELARYIRRGLSFAEGESMISGRPSDFRTKMAAFLSTAAAGASPEMVSDIESRRNSIMEPLNRIKEQPKAQPKAQTPPSQDQQDWDAAVKLYGKDRVLKEYGPRPD